MRDGVSVSLASDADTGKAVDNPSPYEHAMLGIGSDRIGIAYHGIAHTHLDAWNHIHANGVFYNGYTPDAAAVATAGHQRNSIINVKNGIVTRGVLIDIPRLKGVPYLEPGTPIYVSDLEAWEKQAGVRVSAGDALFVRTGVWARRKAVGPWLRGRAEGGRSAGLDPSVIPWLRARDVAVMGSDHPQYVVARSRRAAAGRDSRLCTHLSRAAALRQLRSRGVGGRSRWKKAVDVSTNRGPFANPGRHRIAPQSHSHLLIGDPARGATFASRAPAALNQRRHGRLCVQALCWLSYDG